MERSNNVLLNGHNAPVLHNGPSTALDSSQEATHAPAASLESGQQPVLTKPPDSNLKKEETTPHSPESPRQRPTSLVLVALGVGAIAAGVFGYRWWQYASTHEETDDAMVAGNVHPVSTRINGTVSNVLVRDNQLVQKGQLLVKLDSRDYQIQVQQAEASLEAARHQANAAQSTINLASGNTSANTMQAQGNVASASAAISTSVAAVNEARAGVPAAQAQVAQADANLQKAQADYKRYNSLYQSGAITLQQLDTARAAYYVALAQRNSAVQLVAQAGAKLAQAQENVTKAQAELAASKGGLQQARASGVQTKVNLSQYEAAQAAIAQAQANLKNAQMQLSYTNITAPSLGRVGRKIVQVGQRLQPGNPLMSIVDNDYWVVANYKETQLERMYPGQLVEVKLDAFPHHPFIGRVDSFSPGSGATFALLPPDNATGNYTKIVQRIPVKVVFDPQSIKGYESRITLGMSAVVSVDIK